jgi:sulfite exporter TauE/SafE
MLSFMAGLSGSAHCMGMCGGIVAALAVAAPRRSGFLNLSYHIGRIITYTILGGLAGALSQVALFSFLKPCAIWLFAAANIMVIVIGVATASGLQNFGVSALDGAGWGGMGRIVRQASQRPSPLVFLGTGLLMGLIPCGLVYGVLLTSATSGSGFQGAVTMLAFGLGTLPALMIYGKVATALSAGTGVIFLRIMGCAVALMGIIGLLKTLVRTGLIAPLNL